MARNFSNLANLSAHVRRTEAELAVGVTTGITLACNVFLRETHDILGHYQTATGPYASWAPLASSTVSRRARRGYAPNEPELVTGHLKSTYNVRVVGLEGGVGSADPIALDQEIGDRARNLPARPILGYAFVRAEKRAFLALLMPIEALLI